MARLFLLQHGDQPIDFFQTVKRMDDDAETLAAFWDSWVQYGADIQAGGL